MLKARKLKYLKWKMQSGNKFGVPNVQGALGREV